MPDAVTHRSALTDDDVMRLVVADESVAAFEVLYDRYRDRCHSVARAVCRDDGRAQEAVQEAFISIWRSRANYEDRGNVAAWVMTVVRHRALDVARRDGPHVAHRGDENLLRLTSMPDSVVQTVADRARTHAVVDVLAELPAAQKEVITLAFYGQLTHLEIAAHLDLPLGTVKGRMRLGMRRLRAGAGRMAS